jgi:hypothetical protein
VSIRLSGASFYQDVPSTQIAAGAVALGQILLADGSQAAPALAFASDPDTGLWRVAAGLRAGKDNTLALSIGSAAVTPSVPVALPDGSQAAPSLSFSSDLDTGLWRDATGVRAGKDNSLSATFLAGQVLATGLRVPVRACAVNTQLDTFDVFVVITAVNVTVTLPASPPAGMVMFFHSRWAGGVIARNGQQWNEGLSDQAIVAGQSLGAVFRTSSWYVFTGTTP